MAEVGGLVGPGDVHNFGEWELKENGMLCRDGCRWCVLNMHGELEVGKCGIKRKQNSFFAKSEYDLNPNIAYFQADTVEGQVINPKEIKQSPSMKDLYDSKTTTLKIPLRVFASIVTFSGMTKFCSDAGNFLD